MGQKDKSLSIHAGAYWLMRAVVVTPIIVGSLLFGAAKAETINSQLTTIEKPLLEFNLPISPDDDGSGGLIAGDINGDSRKDIINFIKPPAPLVRP